MITHSVTLYIFTAIAWGSTWIAITFQLGEVAPEISLVYRFAISASVMFLFCYLKGMNMRFTVREHLFIALQGFFLFSLNYLIIYYVSISLTSGLVAVIFSTFVFMNTINSVIFFRNPIRAYIIIGSVIGFLGISLIFWPQLSAFRLSSQTLQAGMLGLLSTYIASLGNMVALRNQKAKLPVMQTNAYGMAYGTLMLLLWSLFNDIPFLYEADWSYTVSLLYLSIVGTVLAFAAYLTLVSRIGVELSGYVVILFPAIALGISTVFEDYHWTVYSIMGVILVLFGNYQVISKGKSIEFASQILRGMSNKSV